MIYDMPRRKIKPLHPVIDDISIECVSEFNFVGLILYVNHTWKSHINKISNMISKSMGILNKLKHFVPIKTKILLYNSLILSHLNFRLLICGF